MSLKCHGGSLVDGPGRQAPLMHTFLEEGGASSSMSWSSTGTSETRAYVGTECTLPQADGLNPA